MPRARLIKDYERQDCPGYFPRYQAGQTGTRWEHVNSDGTVVFYLDGYEKEKARDAEFKQRVGQVSSNVEYLIQVPIDILEDLGEGE
jgi:hypothetical protein